MQTQPLMREEGDLMGFWVDYKCDICEYSAYVAGKPTMGERKYTTTILCEVCQELYDVTTALAGSATSSGQLEKVPVRCPKQEDHRIRSWVRPDWCPKCGGLMYMGENLTIWD